MNKKISDKIILFTFALYPFLPFCKEWSSTVFNAVEIILLLFCMFCAFLPKQGKRFMPDLKLCEFALLFLVFSYVCISTTKFDAFSYLRVILLYVSVIKLLSEKGEEFKAQLLKILAFDVILLCVVGWVQFFFPEALYMAHEPVMELLMEIKSDFIRFSPYNRIISLFNDPNVFGVYLVMAIGIFETNPKRFSKRFLWIIRLLTWSILFLTQSRSAYLLALFMYVLLMARTVLASKTLRRMVLAVALLGIVGVAAFAVFKFDYLHEFLRLENIADGNGRLTKYFAYFPRFFHQNMKSILIGNGVTMGRIRVQENLVTSIMDAYGLLGGACFVFFVIWNMKRVIRGREAVSLVFVFLAGCLLGDFLLIPQVTIMLLFGVLLAGSNRKLPEKPVVLQVLFPVGIGGVEKLAVSLHKSYQEEGFDSYLAVGEQYYTEFSKQLLKNDTSKLVKIKGNGMFSQIRSLKKIIKKTKPNLLHTHARRECVLVSSVKPVWAKHVRTQHMEEKPGKKVLIIEKCMLSTRVDEWISTSETLKRDYLLKLSFLADDKIKVIYNGVKTVETAPGSLTKKAASFCVAGRLTKQKGVDILLSQLPKLPNAVKEKISIDVFGDGEEREALVSMAKENGTDAFVHFYPYQEKLIEKLGEYTAFLMPSRYEGLPLVMLEAMSVSTPVAAHNVGCIAEIIKDGENGWMIQEKEDAWCDFLTKVTDKNYEIGKISQKAQKTYAADFTDERMCKEYAKEYKELLSMTGKA